MRFAADPATHCSCETVDLGASRPTCGRCPSTPGPLLEVDGGSMVESVSFGGWVFQGFAQVSVGL